MVSFSILTAMLRAGAWVDERAPAPLRTVAALGAVPDGEHAAHVRLADGSTLTADVCEGKQVEVATAGASTLVAALEDTTPQHPPSLLGTACASVALGLVGSAFVPRAATAGLLLASAAVASVKRKRPQKRYDLVLTTRLNPDAEQPLRKRRKSELLGRRPSLVGIRSPGPQNRRPSLFSPQKAKCPDFSGTYVLDHGASDSNDEMMAVLGVPWVARRAIRGTKRTIHIEHDGDVWDETTVTKFRTMEDHFDLSGAISASRGAAVPSLHSNASYPGMMDVGGFFFDFEAVRTASRDHGAPRRRESGQN